MFADSTWHLFKWGWSTVLCVYLIVQVLAIKRSAAVARKRSEKVLIAMVVAVTVQSWIKDAFENQAASRISMLAVGVFAATATVYLVSLLRSRELAAGGQQPVEGRGGPLRLS